MFGGGGLNPRKMKQMMKQMGIDVEEIDAEEVVIRTAEADLVFADPQVTRMDAQGQQTYQIVGEPEQTETGGDAGEAEATDDAEAAEAADTAAGGDIPAADVEIVVQRTGASEAAAREALEETDGDLAAAVSKLE